MASAESSEIQVLESVTEGSHSPFLSINAASVGGNVQASSLPLRHRMHRSSVRPFFCCGSEISLVSLVDSVEKDSSDQTVDAEKCSEIAGENNSLDSLIPKAKTVSPKCTECAGSCVSCRRQTSTSRRKKSDKMQGNLNKSKKKFWNLKLRGKLPHSGRYSFHHTHTSDPSQDSTQPTSVSRRDSDLVQSASNQILLDGAASSNVADGLSYNMPLKLIADFDRLYPTDDIDERRMADRAKEIRDGIEIGDKRRSVSPGASHDSDFSAAGAVSTPPRVLCQMFESHCSLSSYPPMSRGGYGVTSDYEESLYGELDFSSPAPSIPKGIHTQVDYMHCLVPELTDITNCSFYWGEMDRYEAERLLENKPEGTFLLRDSAQEDFLFSVSFRRYNRSLHARIEQWNHKFSFDAHDPAVFSTETVCGLIEHYKDPNCCMFFEPMLTMPLNRSFPFSLQRLCRSSISDHIVYNSIAYLPLPKALKEYITCYHYKQKVRVRQVDMPN